MDTALETAPIGASVWERELHDMLTSYVAKERCLLEDYVDAARSTDSQALGYLVDLLIDDEKRHHRMFLDLAKSLRSEAELATDAPVPRLDFDRHNASAVVEVAQRLLDNEHEDVRELKRLRKVLKDVEDTTVWGILVDPMIRDTQKHIAVL